MNEQIDGRKARGDRTRRSVAGKAAELASVHGLDGMSLGQVAEALEIPKSSVQVAYRNKEELQLGTIKAGTSVFVRHVIAPANDAAPGRERLDSLIVNWMAYIGERVLPGGCFMGATFAEHDSKPGPVRDALAISRRQWLGVIEEQVEVAQRQGEAPSTPAAALIAFEIDALLAAANVARNLHDDDGALETAAELIRLRLDIG